MDLDNDSPIMIIGTMLAGCVCGWIAVDVEPDAASIAFGLAAIFEYGVAIAHSCKISRTNKEAQR